MSYSTETIRVAVIGGGCAALATAFELTRPEHRGRYQVTVYQMGWRLGGKGASGRGVADRVEEHGLHLWMGFYENAFRLMRDCYAERRAAFPHCRFADWQDAFKPAPDVGVADRSENGWAFWLAHFPPGEGLPGDPENSSTSTVLGYIRQSVVLIGELLRAAAGREPSPAGEGCPGAPDGHSPPGRGPDALAAVLNTLLRYGQLASTAALCEATAVLRETLDYLVPQVFDGATAVPLQILDIISSAARRQLQQLVSGDTELRRIWQVVDLSLAIVRGFIRCGLAFDPRGLDAINDYDCREWLGMHGASEDSLNSGFMRGIYDLVFAFEDGDVNRPRQSAGVALRGALRMFFTYRGALFWRMSAGMGEIVFSPLYQVLKHRGVRFEFFHRLRNVGLSAETNGEPPYIQTLDFDVQARVKGGGEYQPLIDVHNVPVWPSRPDFAQLVGGSAIEREDRNFEAPWERRLSGRKKLQVTRDFDFVVLGVSLGALPDVASELIEREPRWRDMVHHIRTVPTQAFQLWLSQDARGLGWPYPPINLSGFKAPFDTWADMSHLIPEESWSNRVRGIAYFCSVLPDGATHGTPFDKEFQERQREIVRANAVDFLEQDSHALWPLAVRPGGGFRWDLLVSDPETTDAERFEPSAKKIDTQFWTANVNPSDRYVQSLPGTVPYRLSPLDMTFDNLTIAGDWTASGLDAGCIESAVMSGLLAAHAISRTPPLEKIVGYDHP